MERSLLDHLVGGGEELRVEFQPERLGGVEVDHELELAGLDHRQMARLLALENSPGIEAGLVKSVGDARAIAAPLAYSTR